MEGTVIVLTDLVATVITWHSDVCFPMSCPFLTSVVRSFWHRLRMHAWLPHGKAGWPRESRQAAHAAWQDSHTKYAAEPARSAAVACAGATELEILKTGSQPEP